MVISEKYVADQLKALNMGMKPTKEQVEEALLFIDTVRVNHPDKYKKYQKDVFDPYELAVYKLNKDFAIERQGIIAVTGDNGQILHKIVSQSVLNTSRLSRSWDIQDAGVPVATSEQSDNVPVKELNNELIVERKTDRAESVQIRYSLERFDMFKGRIVVVQNKLEQSDERGKKLLVLLNAMLQSPSVQNINDLQTEILSGRTGVTVSKKGDPDGFFGPRTMSALETIAGVKIEEAKVVASTQQAGVENTPTQTGQQATLLQVAQNKVRAAGEAIANTVSGTANAQGVDKKSDKPPVDPNPKSKPGEGFVLKDGTKVQGIFVKEGRVWFIGEKGERKELNPSLLPDGVNAKEIAATNEKAEKLMPLASDAELVLQAVANHAAIEKWPSAAKWGNKISEFRDMLSKLDVSDYNSAREKILKFILSAPTAKSNIAWEFADVFASLDNDAERHAKVYKYIRGSWYNPLASGAGFAGGSEMLSNRIASAELAKKKIGAPELARFVNHWMDKSWGSFSDKEVAGAIMRSQDAGGMFTFVKEAYGEKNLVDFVKDFRRAAKDIDKAFADPKIDKELSKVIPEKAKRDAHVLESKKAKLMTILSTSSLAAYAGTHESELSKNSELKTFADIQGVGTFDMSDTTAKYVRKDLWIDIGIEVLAIGAGTVTAGLGAAAIHALAATRWGMRAGEIARIGNRATNLATKTEYLELNAVGKTGKLMSKVIGGGGMFEGAHVAARKGLTGQEIFTKEGYSTEGFLQSMAFVGAFEAVNKIIKLEIIAKKFDITDFDKTIPLYKQKKLLVKYVAADALVSVGVSYGISWKHDENYTFQEMFQAIAMAALFRTAMTKADGVPLFRAKKTTEGIMVEPVIVEQVVNMRTKLADLMIGENMNVTPNIQVKRTKDGYRVIDRTNGRTESNFVSVDELMMSGFTKMEWTPGSIPLLTYSDPTKVFKVRSPTERKRGSKTNSASAPTSTAAPAGAPATTPTATTAATVAPTGNSATTGTPVAPPKAKAEKTAPNEDATPAAPKPPEEGSGVQPEKKVTKEKKEAKEIYHVLEYIEPTYQNVRKAFFDSSWAQKVAAWDKAWQKWPLLLGKLYGVGSWTVKFSASTVEKLVGASLRSATTLPDVVLNFFKSFPKDPRPDSGTRPWNAIRSVLLADRRTSKQYVDDMIEKNKTRWDGKEVSIKDRRWMDPVVLTLLGTASAFNHESENLVEGWGEIMKAILFGGLISLAYRNPEMLAAVTVPGVPNPFKKDSTSGQNVDIVEEKPFEPNPVDPTQETKAEDETPAEAKSEDTTPSDSAADASQESESKTPETPDAPASSDEAVNQ